MAVYAIPGRQRSVEELGSEGKVCQFARAVSEEQHGNGISCQVVVFFRVVPKIYYQQEKMNVHHYLKKGMFKKQG